LSYRPAALAIINKGPPAGLELARLLI